MQNKYNGIINVYKEKGYTSHDVVAKLRGILKQRKIGHTGTLDPEAEGVLPVTLGNATKLCELLADKEKTYLAVMKLGVISDTEDMTGNIEVVTDENKIKLIDDEIIKDTINSFLGEYEQTPPMYSALKVDGKKLYELAREGKVIERKKRKISILDIDVKCIDKPYVTFSVTCSKGTYVRSLCRDIGEKLKCGGCMESLVRTRVSNFKLEDAYKLSDIEEMVKSNKDDFMTSIEDMLSIYKSITVNSNYDKLVLNGNKLLIKDLYQDKVISEETKLKDSKDIFRIYSSQNTLVGLYSVSDEYLKPLKMFT